MTEDPGPVLGQSLNYNYNQMVIKDQSSPSHKCLLSREERMSWICRAKLPSVRILLRTKIGDEDAKNGVTKGIGRNGCTACPFLTSKPNQVIKMVEVYNTGKKVQVDRQINCKTRGGSCTCCGTRKHVPWQQWEDTQG